MCLILSEFIISNLHKALWSYVGFLAIIWFTWLQVTLFDIRFARDSICERMFKASQLATMVGFASAGSGFSTEVRDENVWAFHSLSALLATNRLMLSIQYSITAKYLYKPMKFASKRLLSIALVLLATSATYTGVSVPFSLFIPHLIHRDHQPKPVISFTLRSMMKQIPEGHTFGPHGTCYLP